MSVKTRGKGVTNKTNTNITSRLQEIEENFALQLGHFKGELAEMRKDDGTPENNAKIDQLMQKFLKFEASVNESLTQFKQQVNEVTLQIDMHAQKLNKNKLLLYGVK